MYPLTELVRILEQQGHRFDITPQHATDALRHSDGSPAEKLYRRAQLLDRDGSLNSQLQQHRRISRWLLNAATVLWLLLGFASAYGLMLMQQGTLNFFLMLAVILSGNTFNLLLWLVMMMLRRPTKPGILAALYRPKANNPVSRALAELYHRQFSDPVFFWHSSRISHRLWLATLSGTLLAVFLLLLVRQYQFNWESTLLGDKHFAHIAAALSWLPAQLGFNVPSPDAFTHRHTILPAEAAQWGSLLLGSLLCYGWLPRAAALAVSSLISRRRSWQPDLNQAYYQTILRQWQRRIIDSDDYRPDTPAAPRPHTTPEHSQHWAVLLDAPGEHPIWQQHIAAHYRNCGNISNRQELNELETALQQQSVFLLIGVRACQVPDRGQIRQINRLALAAQAGVQVQLLTPPNAQATCAHTITQWQQTLQNNGIVWEVW